MATVKKKNATEISRTKNKPKKCNIRIHSHNIYIYTLFDGLTYNTSNEQNVSAYFMLNQRANKRFIILLQKITSSFVLSSRSARKPVKPGFCSANHNSLSESGP